MFDDDLIWKNVLVVRQALIQSFNKHSEEFPGLLAALNSSKSQKQCADILQRMIDLENYENTRNSLLIFCAAISANDLSKLDSDENLLLKSQVIQL